MGLSRITGAALFVSLWFAFNSSLLPAETTDPAEKKPGEPLASESGDEYYELLRLFVETLDQVERNYVKDVSRRELIEAAIDGMLSKLDEHTNYVGPEDMDRFRTAVENEFPGIGVQLDVVNGKLTVLSALPDTPAQRAGLSAGDVIVRVNGVPTEKMKLDDAIRRLKGNAGTEVTLDVFHPATSKDASLTLTRELVQVETVRGYRHVGEGRWNFFCDAGSGIAYVRVTAFGRRTAEELKKTLEQLASQDLKAVVLDLRFNPGGLLSTAVQVADLFVDEGRIVSTSGRNVKEQIWDAHREGTFSEFPLAVLVNQYSASASEIVAACLQDHQRAVVVGQRTLGKGSVQNIVELEEGRSALKLTTASYHRPSGKNIERQSAEGESGDWGVKPDRGFEIALSDQATRKLYAMISERERATAGSAPSGAPPYEDRQLDKAVAWLRQKMASKPASTQSQPVEAKTDGPAEAKP